MVLMQDDNLAQFQIQAYAEGSIVVNGQKYTKSLIISPNQLITDWPVTDIRQITTEQLTALWVEGAEIILLGTGPKSVILSDEILAPLLEKHYNVECMNTGAACRTYTALSAEGRKVVAGLII